MFFILAILLVIFIITSAIIGQKIKDLKAFTSTSAHFFSLICTVISSFIGGVFIIGHLEQGFSHGIAPFLTFLGFPLQLILIGFFITQRRIKTLTVGELFEPLYGRYAKIFIGFIVVGFNLGIVTIAFYSVGLILGQNIISYIYLVIFFLLFILSCSLGGISSVIWVSILEFIVIITTLFLGLIWSIYHYKSLNLLIGYIPITHWQILNGYSYAQLFSMFIATLLGNALMPSVIGTINIARSKQQAKMSYILAGLFITVFALFLNLCGMGVAGVCNGCSIQNALDSVFLTAPFLLQVFIVIGLLVLTASKDLFLNIAAVTFVNDILKTLRINIIDDLKLVRICMFVFGLTCITLSFFMSLSLIYSLLFLYKFWGPLFLASFLGIYFNKTISQRAFFINIAITFFTMTSWHISGLEKTTNIHDLVIGLTVNFVLYGVARKMAMKK